MYVVDAMKAGNAKTLLHTQMSKLFHTMAPLDFLRLNGWTMALYLSGETAAKE